MRNEIAVLNEHLERLTKHMSTDYYMWSRSSGGDNEDIKLQMEEEYSEGLYWTVGSKYIKVISKKRHQESVCLFVVNSSKDKKFELGDILKPAGWNAPARNFKRANIFDVDTFDRVRWTGA